MVQPGRDNDLAELERGASCLRRVGGRDPAGTPVSVGFRNVDGTPAQPVREWPYEALVAAVQRGTVGDWLGIIREIEASPWGKVARRIELYLGYEQPYGVGPLLARTIARSRAAAAESERAAVAAEVRDLIARSGLTREQFAQEIGTSRSRLSTYASGRVNPAASLLVRMRRAVDSIDNANYDPAAA